MATVTLNIDGMTCGGCVRSVIQILTDLEGVIHADVSLENKTAIVEFDNNKIKGNQLVDAVESGGFDVNIS